MKVQILQIGETKTAPLKALETEYERRLQPFLKLEVLSLQASKHDQRERVQNEEKERIEAKLDSQAHILALDERGKQMTSEDLAEFVKEVRDFGPGKIQILIGGSHGLHPDLLAAAHTQLSFSKMTFTHEMIRVFLREQLYRACSILAGKTYHK
jgi:23S rRNA (pseudouridine1915-N3)-methyltransferase